MTSFPTPHGPQNYLKSVPHFNGSILPLPSSGAQGARDGLVNESQRIASATTMAPSTNNLYWVGMYLQGGAGPSWLELTFQSPNKLIFPAFHGGISDATGSIGQSRPIFYPMNWQIPGTNGIASGSQTFGGDLAVVRFIYSNRPNPGGLDISKPESLAFLGEAMSADETGTSGTNTTYTFTAGKSKPRAIMAVANIEATASGVAEASIGFPKIGSYNQLFIPCYNPISDLPPLTPLPDYDPSTTIVLVHKADSLGGATNVTVGGYLYYNPTGA
jgi:hypothetical protein